MVDRRAGRGRRPRRGRRGGLLAVLLAIGAAAAVAVTSWSGHRTEAPAKPRIAPDAARRRTQPAVERVARASAPVGDPVARLVRLALPVFCGGPRGRDVALTFDDGPGPYTALALRILERAHARATFFLVGRNLARWPGLPREERLLGALGDHTWTHPDLRALPPGRMRDELARTQRAVQRLSGRPVELFRPPYGAHDAAIDGEARRLGMLEALWSVDSADSEGADYLQIARLVLRRIRPGAIVLMHENRGQTIRALKFFVLPALRRRGLRAVSVPQLLAADPPSLRQLREGWSGCYPHGSGQQP